MYDPASRRSAHRPVNFVIVPGSQEPQRDFRIAVYPHEGWDEDGHV